MSSTLLTEDTGVPFHQLQAEQIQRFRDAWQAAGHEREPRVSVSRSIFPIVSDLDRAYFGRETATARTRSGSSTAATARASARPTPPSRSSWCEQLAEDEAIAAADTLLLTVPNQLGVDYNAHVLESVADARRPGARLALTYPRDRAIEERLHYLAEVLELGGLLQAASPR